MIPLKPNLGSDSEAKPYGVFDIEATSWINFLCLGYYDGVRYEQFIGVEGITEFIHFLFEDQEVPPTIYAHFGGKYDFLFLLSDIVGMEEYQIEDMIPRGSGILSFTVVKGKKKIKFSDSHAFLPFSLRKLSEDFGVEHVKQEIDYTKITVVTDELLFYMKYDVLGLYEVIGKYRDWPLIKKAGPRLTMASQALSVLSTFITKPIPSINDEEIDTFVRRAYFGGRTEIFRPYYNSKTKPLMVFDVNSLYPSVMRDNHFPDKFKEMVSGEFIENEMGFYRVKVRVPQDMYVPPLGTVHDVGDSQKFIFPTGEFWGHWSSIELSYAMSLGVELLEVEQGAIFRDGGPIFKDYINSLYEIRLKASKNSVDDILSKLLMNSCYGRFGLNKDREELLFDDGDGDDVDTYCELETRRGKVRIIKRDKQLENTFSNVSVAAWVTSLARIHMHKIYLQCEDSLHYTDTDSIFTIKNFGDSKELGGLKKEDSWNAAVFLLPKTYLAKADILKKVVMKGFDKKKIQHFEVQDFYTALEGDLRALKVDVDPQVARFKSALAKGKFLMMTEKSTKQIRSQYDKREIYKKKDGTYDTRPLHIENGVIINGLSASVKRSA